LICSASAAELHILVNPATPRQKIVVGKKEILATPPHTSIARWWFSPGLALHRLIPASVGASSGPQVHKDAARQVEGAGLVFVPPPATGMNLVELLKWSDGGPSRR
jgi:hypothetical protein